MSPPWGLRPPPPWREACLGPAWRSAELGPQKPHCAHPTDPLGRRNGSPVLRGPTSGSHCVGDWGVGMGCQPGPAVERPSSGLGMPLGDVMATPVVGPGSFCAWGQCLLLRPSILLEALESLLGGKLSGKGTFFPPRCEAEAPGASLGRNSDSVVLILDSLRKSLTSLGRFAGSPMETVVSQCRTR